MSKWFEVKVELEKTQENGTVKNVKEVYVVYSEGITEAESKIVKEVAPFSAGAFEITSVRKDYVSEVFYDETADKWYRAKVNFITLDEKTGTEKKKASYMLVQAASFKEAYDNLEIGMRGTISDYEVSAITETSVVELYHE